MFIKSIHLDGFKSYQKSTEIEGFSNKFNAITGYNGSGKSNVLDSICFILGINKLDNIRAKSMAELISHGGTKATVQIRFDNEISEFSPFGMQHLKEIVVQRTIIAQASGKGCATNYTLNGHACTNAKIHDFFRSIGLNPEEILGMIEEAAGTKMFDQKKKDAEKTMFVKEAKIKEIDKIFAVSIDPRMEKFREDRKNMVEVTRLTKNRDSALRKLDAFQFFQILEQIKRDREQVEVVKVQVVELEKRILEIGEDLEKKEEEKKQVEENRNNKDLDDELHAELKQKQEVKFAAEGQKAEITDEISRLTKEVDIGNRALVKDRVIIDKEREKLESGRAQGQEAINEFKEQEELGNKYRDELESLARGTVANDQGQHVSIEHEVQECRTKVSTLEASIKTAKNRKERTLQRTKELQREHDNLASRSKSEISSLGSLQTDVNKLSEKINNLHFDQKKYETDSNLISAVQRELDSIEANRKTLTENNFNARFQLNYTEPPVPNFDRRYDILGCIAHMCKLKPGAEPFSMAVEIAVAPLSRGDGVMYPDCGSRKKTYSV
ncbi:unnamed protein product [Caenorhabditis sp. 36 PRJEB53466]|nr:unnamed protein product [Caenorhabditis sp. 36 PRJEB53466]